MLPACLLRFCVVYNAYMEHAACLSTCHTTEAATATAHRLQQRQSMASRLHKHQCAFFFSTCPPPHNTMRVCCTWQSKCSNALILLVSVEHFVYLYSHHFSPVSLSPSSLFSLSLKLYYFCSAVQILALTFVKRALCVPTHTVVRCENNMNALLPAN